MYLNKKNIFITISTLIISFILSILLVGLKNEGVKPLDLIENLNSYEQIVLKNNDLRVKIKDLEVQGNKHIAITSDAWFTIRNTEKNLKNINLDIQDLKVLNNNIKIYINRGDGYSENDIQTYYIKNGNNVICFENPKNIFEVRMDITSDVGESYKLNKVVINDKKTIEKSRQQDKIIIMQIISQSFLISIFSLMMSLKKINLETNFAVSMIFLFVIFLKKIYISNEFILGSILVTISYIIIINRQNSKLIQDIFFELKDIFRLFYNFCVENYKVILIATLVLILSYNYEASNFSLSIDEEYDLFRSGNPSPGWVSQGRFSIYILQYIFGAKFSPGFTTIVTAIMLFLSSIVWCFSYDEYIKVSKRYKKIIYICFISTYISLPAVNACYFSFSMYSFEVSIGMLLTSISFVIFDKYATKYKKSIFCFIVPSLILAFSIGVYQNYTSMFITATVGMIFLRIIQENQISFIKNYILLSLITFCEGIVGYFLLNKLFLFITNAGKSEYVQGFIRWGLNTPLQDKIVNCIKANLIFFIPGKIYGLTFLFVVSISLGIIIMLKKEISISKKIILMFSMCIFFISPLSLGIILGGEIPIRSMQSLLLFISLAWTIIFVLIKDSKHLKVFFIILCIYSIYVQSSQINKVFYGENQRYHLDISLGDRIMYDILEVQKGTLKKPVVFIGKYSHDNPSIIKIENLGNSFFEWDQGNNSRIFSFLKTRGYKLKEASMEQVKESEIYSKNMNNWPEDGSVQEWNGVVIVRLSEASDFWKLVNIRE